MSFPALGAAEVDEETEMVMNTLLVCVFIISVYAGGALMKMIQGPALVAEILIGLLFATLKWFPTHYIDAFKCLGYVGLLLMIFDGGVHMDIPMLKKVGPRAFALAVSGCFALANGGPAMIIVTIIIAILSKFITGFLATGCRDRKFLAYTCQVGTAMVGRGELGFVQIHTAMSQGILGKGAKAEAAFGAIVWALLVASLVGPVLFRLTLKMKPRDAAPGEESFVMAYNSGEQQPADVEGGLPRLLNNRTANDVGIDAKKEKVSDVPTAENVQA